MLIYQNGLITLNYNPSTDILWVDLPDMMHLAHSELDRTLNIIAENIRNYHIRYLLIDSSNMLLGEIEDELYKKMVGNFLKVLTKTRLQKIARINSSEQAYEVRLKAVASQNLPSPTSINLKTFPDKASALEWLLEIEDRFTGIGN